MTKKFSNTKAKRGHQSLEIQNEKLNRRPAALNKDHELYRALIEQSPLSIEIYSPDGTQQEVNYAWQELFGLNPEDSVGKYNCLEDEQAVKSGSSLAFERVLSGTPVSIPDFEYDPVKSGYPKGRKRWLRSNFFPLKDHDGKVSHVVLMHEDISDRIKTSAKYKWVVENAIEAILVIQDEKIIFFNQKTVELLGYSFAEITRKKYYEFIHPDDRDRIVNLHNGRMNGSETPELLQLRNVTKSGKIKWLQTNGILIEWDDKPATLVFASDISALKEAEEQIKQHQEQLEQMVVEKTRDLVHANQQLTEQIRERHKAEEALLAEKNKLEAVLGAMGDGLTLQDRKFRILYQNAAHISKQGFHVGEYCYKAYQHRDSVCDGCGMAKCFKDGKIHKRESTAIATDGSKYYMEVTANPLKDSYGNIIGGVEVVRDITEMKKLNAQLMQSCKMEAIGTLAGGIAHDFNNILTGIVGYAELAQLEARTGSVNPDNLQEISRAGKRATDLVKQILTFSRRSEQKRAPLHLQPIIKEALKLLRSTIPSTIEIRQDISPDCGAFMGDVTQVHQVIVNLCTNAYQAMLGKAGTLGVVCREKTVARKKTHGEHGVPPGKYIRLSISDTGHGIDPDDLCRIFEPYFTNNISGDGTGLGLATVHGIIKGHEGYITVQSEPGVGSRFDVYFPLLQDQGDTEDSAGRRQDTLPVLKGRVLLIDDEEMIVGVTKRIIERLGCRVTTFTSSIEAFDHLKSDMTAYDLVITDQTMPGLTGYDLACRILEIRPDMPIILATGHSDSVDREKAEKAGIHSFFMKPFDLHQLSAVIADILG